MSLINDALKRASQTKTPPPPLGQPEPPLKPVEYKRPSRWPLLLLPVLVATLGLACWFVLKAWQTERAAKLTALKLPVVARELPDEKAPAEPAVIKAPGTKNDRAPSSIQGGTNAEPSTNAQTVVAEPAKPAFPAVRLQGIFYRPNHPSVMINSKTVSVGDKVSGTKVVAVSRDSVTLEWHGETNVLTLE